MTDSHIGEQLHHAYRTGDENGSATVLAIGLLFLALVTIGLSIDTTRLMLTRRALQNAADAAALAGASRIDQGVWRTSGGKIRRLLPAAAAEESRQFFGRQMPPGSYGQAFATTESVRFRAVARVEFVFLSWLGASSTLVSAEAEATPAVPGLWPPDPRAIR